MLTKLQSFTLRNFLLLIFLLITPRISFAHGDMIDGIYYTLISPNYTEAAVTYKGDYLNPVYYYTDDVVIPSAISKHDRTYPVTAIGQYAFKGCYDLETVIIPSSVDSIGFYAFEGCTGLKNIDIPSSVRTIDRGAFYWCEGLTSVTIPNNVITETKKFIHSNLL